MKPLTKARFERVMYAVGAIAAWGLTLASVYAMFAGIDSAVENVIHILFGVTLGAIQAAAWVDARATVRALTGQTDLLIDPDCRDGKCSSCVGGPCQHLCHTESEATR